MDILKNVKDFWVNKEWREMDNVYMFEQVILTITLFAWIGLFFIDWKIGLCMFFIAWGNNICEKRR